MRILNEQDMWNAVSLNDVMNAIENAFAIHKAGSYVMPERYIAQKENNMMLYMPCFIETMIGTKMLAEFPDNSSKGLPYLNGLMILNDAETGLPKAILNGSTLTAMRTGAVGGVALRYLAPADSTRVGLAGCGVQGLHQLLYACEVRPIQEIYLFDTYVKDFTPFIQKLSERLQKPDIKITVCATARELAEHSDILISATQTVEPLYPDEENLLRGKCFVAIGSWRPERRELPDAVYKLVKNVYTELPYACEESGDLLIPLQSGVLTPDRVCYMEDLIADTKAGQSHEQTETRCFKSVGMSLYDVCTAQIVYENAIKKNLGQNINW